MPQDNRAIAITRRTYNRPLENGTFENWEQTVERSGPEHHRWLWANAGGTPNESELDELRQLMLQRKGLVSGRTLWLGGTEYAKTRSCAMYNCSFTEVRTVYDAVDAFWLLLNGCGVGVKPIPGTLHGFLRPITAIEVIPSTRGPSEKGPEENYEQHPSASNDYCWRIVVGDSAKAWAKSLGKILNPQSMKANKLILDFSQVRGRGQRLKGYGWICNGWEPLKNAYLAIVKILNAKAGDLLDEIDILDVINHLGTVLSSRRSAQIALMDHGNPRWEEFARAKQDFWLHDNAHRQQSNNTLLFWHRPSRKEIRGLMEMIWECGGSEPGFCNAAAARRRAPYFSGLNPCGEILLPVDGFCNLVTTVTPKFSKSFSDLLRAIHILGRANYRQTCVDLRDGLLSAEWHQTNESLRLCGMSLTGLAQSPWLTDYQIKQMRNAAVAGCYSMADELGLPRPKLITTLKPEGTGSKICSVTEGIHMPLGRFIMNWVNFSADDPIPDFLKDYGYQVMDNPNDKFGRLVCFPVDYSGCRFTNVNGRQVNLQTAVQQLEAYRRWNTLWADHNVSITVSWDVSELDEIVDWLDARWEDFVAVSWLRRADPTLTAKDLGYPYLPQEVVTEESYQKYTETLREVDWGKLDDHETDFQSDECKGGVCPVR